MVTDGSRSLLLASSTFLLLGLAAMLLALSGQQSIYLAAAGQLLIILVFQAFASNGSYDTFSPAVVFSLVASLSYPWQVLLVGQGNDRFVSSFPGLAQRVAPSGSRAAILGALAIAAVGTGMALSSRVFGPKDPQREAEILASERIRHFQLRIFLVAAFGLLLTVLLVFVAGGIGSLVGGLSNRLETSAGRSYLSFGPVLITCAGIVRLLSDNRWPPRLGTVLLLSTGVASTLLTGSKALIGFGLVMVGAIVHWRYRRINFVKLLAGGLVLVFALQMYNVVFRDAIPRGVPISQSIADRGGISGMLGNDFVGNTFFGHQALMIGSTLYPDPNPYLWTYSIRATMFAPIPRAIYASKPDSIASPFTIAFAPEFRKRGSSVPPTLFGEGLISFGVVGLVGYAFVYGLIVDELYRRRNRSSLSLYLAALAVSSMLHVLRGELLASSVFVLLAAGAGFVMLRSRAQYKPFRIEPSIAVAETSGRV